MKKKLAVLVMTAIILCMTGCGGQEKESLIVPQKIQEEQQTEPKETHKEENAAIAEPQGIPETLNAVYLDVTFEEHWDNCYEDAFLMNAKYNSINLQTTDYPALTEAVNQFNTEYISVAQGYVDELKKNALSDYKEMPKEHWIGPYEFKSKMLLKRADDKVLAVEEQVYCYEGGIHGVSFYDAYNFDVQTGERIALEDVITDMDSLADVLITEITEKYPDLGDWDEHFWDDVFEEYITPTQEEYQPTFTWTLGYDGVTFYFSNYEIGSYADGVQRITLCYSEYPQILNDDYFKNVDNHYVTRADDISVIGIDTDLNSDGVTDFISVTPNYDYEMDYIESYNVTVNGNTFTQDSYCYEYRSYLVKADNRNYIYVERMVENDYWLITVFEVTENSVEYMGETDGSLGCFTNSLDFEVEKRMDVLSTYTASADCCVGEDGMPVEKNGIYKVKSELSITSIAEIEAELVDEEGNLTGEGYCFPAGTDFKFMATDGETFADMLTSDGQRCRLYTENEWPVTVNGRNAEECFEMLWYAG